MLYTSLAYQTACKDRREYSIEPIADVSRGFPDCKHVQRHVDGYTYGWIPPVLHEADGNYSIIGLILIHLSYRNIREDSNC
jgi:hypothetical protein